MSNGNTEDSRSGLELGRVTPQEWLRGPARIDGEWVVLDRNRARTYSPIEEADLMYDLAAVRRPPDALAFVQRYGLLRHGPEQDDHRERYQELEKEALRLSNVLRLHTIIALAVGNDREEANDAIRELWSIEPDLRPIFEARAANDDELIDQATHIVAVMTNEGLAGVDFKVEPSINYEGGKRGDFSLCAWSPTLLGSIYHQLALSIVNRVPLRACVECRRYFPVKDKRQQFCSPTCSSRARQRRYADKKRLGEFEVQS